MLTKNQIKLITSLSRKKYRKEYNMFVAEGEKIVLDLIRNNVEASHIICTQTYVDRIGLPITEAECTICDEKTIKKISNLSTASDIIGIFNIPDTSPDKDEILNGLSLLLDDIQDPGNLGTIIRTADWFGIKHIFCSNGTADVYNPKVIQSTMGAIAKVKVIYTDLPALIQEYSSCDFPVYGTFLEGSNIYSETLSPKGFIVMGNEGKGISEETEQLITNKINIPAYNPQELASESLNVATATAVICSEFRKTSLQ